MGSTSKSFSLLFVVIFSVSSLILVEYASAQPTPKPPVPEFTLKYVDRSYEVPLTTTSSTRPYTNKTTVIPVPGYYVDNKTVDALIKNDIGVSYFNFRYKPHYGDKWSYYPFSPDNTHYIFHSALDLSSLVYTALSSDYATVSLTFLPEPISEDGKIDVQVQALFGDYNKQPSGMRSCRNYNIRFYLYR
jgi:hypothetical protein